MMTKSNLYRQYQKTAKIPYQLYNRRPGIDYGWLEVATGNMFSGKSEHLIMSYFDIIQADNFFVRSAQREGIEVVSRKIRAYKHSSDNRYDENSKIVAHSGMSMPCKTVATVDELVLDILAEDVHVAMVDEIQFFQEKNEQGEYAIVEAALLLLAQKRFLLLAGLDKDFRGLPFGPIGDLLAIADAKPYYVSTCAVCGAPATLPQRLIDGKPAHFDDPIVLVGAAESYEPRCRDCHQIEMNEKSALHRQSAKNVLEKVGN